MCYSIHISSMLLWFKSSNSQQVCDDLSVKKKCVRVLGRNCRKLCRGKHARYLAWKIRQTNSNCTVSSAPVLKQFYDTWGQYMCGVPERPTVLGARTFLVILQKYGSGSIIKCVEYLSAELMRIDHHIIKSIHTCSFNLHVFNAFNICFWSIIVMIP
jgi:hypothetical protein